MTIIASTILVKSIKDHEQLTFFDKLAGWFLLEHVFEEYAKTAGKFFTCNEDFRRLILNLFKTTRNILFWSQLITLTEFTLLITIIIGLSWFLVLQLKLNPKTNKIFDLIFLYFYLTLTLLLLIKLCKTFTKYDFLIIFKGVTILLLITFTFKSTSLTILNFYNKFIKPYHKVITPLKLYTYMVTCFILTIIFIFKIIIYNTLNNNINVELTTQILPVYLLYYTL